MYKTVLCVLSILEKQMDVEYKHGSYLTALILLIIPLREMRLCSHFVSWQVSHNKDFPSICLFPDAFFNCPLLFQSLTISKIDFSHEGRSLPFDSCTTMDDFSFFSEETPCIS